MLEEVYEGLPRLSADYGIMEKAGGVPVFPGDFGWDDIGSRTALETYLDGDGRGNVLDIKKVFIF
ncbi:MAG: hypothetical protein ACYC0Q_02390 [Eubacteriales bacterium]